MLVIMEVMEIIIIIICDSPLFCHSTTATIARIFPNTCPSHISSKNSVDFISNTLETMSGRSCDDSPSSNESKISCQSALAVIVTKRSGLPYFCTMAMASGRENLKCFKIKYCRNQKHHT